jgi:hypothetical protein
VNSSQVIKYVPLLPSRPQRECFLLIKTNVWINECKAEIDQPMRDLIGKG